MAKFCTGCGKELQDGLMFCTDCGTKVPENIPAQTDAVKEEIPVAPEVKQEPVAQVAVESPPPPPPTPPTPPPQQAQQQYIPSQQAQPQQNPQQPPMQVAQSTENHSASTAHFFWMMLVYALPLIGWLICIIMAFAPKNESKKHFARAILIWSLIGIIISIISLIIMSLLGGGISELLSGIY